MFCTLNKTFQHFNGKYAEKTRDSFVMNMSVKWCFCKRQVKNSRNLNENSVKILQVTTKQYVK